MYLIFKCVTEEYYQYTSIKKKETEILKKKLMLFISSSVIRVQLRGSSNGELSIHIKRKKSFIKGVIERIRFPREITFLLEHSMSRKKPSKGNIFNF